MTNPGYKSSFYLVLTLLFIAFGCIWLQKRIGDEKMQALSYTICLAKVNSSIKKGMTKTDVISLVGDSPDKIRGDQNELILEWSASHRSYPYLNFFDPKFLSCGHFLTVVLTADGLVESSAFEPCK